MKVVMCCYKISMFSKSNNCKFRFFYKEMMVCSLSLKAINVLYKIAFQIILLVILYIRTLCCCAANDIQMFTFTRNLVFFESGNLVNVHSIVP